MITVKQALSLFKKYDLDESHMRHSKGVAQFAFNLAAKIHKKHPSLAINPEKVRIAALLHDIGRSMQGDHEINSITLLKQEGLEEIAEIVMHGSMYEISVIRGKPDQSLLPKTVENKIVAYADARFKNRLVSLKERFKEVLKRRKLEKEKVESVKMAEKRYYEIEKEVMALAGYH
ncbi:MAG TPA: HD domain-containing protein [Chitinivibrionales bacterium]|nr:HD domain-containing protein [Chitinivibrionales bacterium]